MENNRTKKIALNTLLLIFCCVIISLFCLAPSKVDVAKLETYKVNFDSDGGTSVVAIEVEDGSIIEKPDDPTKEGYEFVGWMLGDELYDFSHKVDGDITLKATWQEIKPNVVYYTVTFDSVGGTPQGNQVIEAGKVAVKPNPDPVKENFTFDGWMLNGNPFNFATPINSDITLVAGWTAVEPEPEPENPEQKPDEVTYTVTFNTAGGSKVATQTVKEGATATKPKNPTRSGYTFKGWYTTASGSKTFSFSTKITKNTTVYAQWTKNSSSGGGSSSGGNNGHSSGVDNKVTYNVRFHSHYPNNTDSVKTRTYDSSQSNSARTISAKSPSIFSAPAHYNFSGWSRTSGGSVITSPVVITKSQDFYANWTMWSKGSKTYTIGCKEESSTGTFKQCRLYVSNADGTISWIRDGDDTTNYNNDLSNVSEYNRDWKGSTFNIRYSDGFETTARAS